MEKSVLLCVRGRLIFLYPVTHCWPKCASLVKCCSFSMITATQSLHGDVLKCKEVPYMIIEYRLIAIDTKVIAAVVSYQ